MVELKELLPLFSFIGTICIAVSAGLLVKGHVMDMRDTLKELVSKFDTLNDRVTRQETICKYMIQEHEDGRHD